MNPTWTSLTLAIMMTKIYDKALSFYFFTFAPFNLFIQLCIDKMEERPLTTIAKTIWVVYMVVLAILIFWALIKKPWEKKNGNR